MNEWMNDNDWSVDEWVKNDSFQIAIEQIYIFIINNY